MDRNPRPPLAHGGAGRPPGPGGCARLGELTVKAGVVMEAELQNALTRDDVLLGQALVEAGVLDDQTLQRALVLQLLRRLERLFGLPVKTAWSFEAKVDAFEGLPPGVRIDTLRVLWAGITAHGEMGPWLEASLRRIGESPFKVRHDVNLRRFGFTVAYTKGALIRPGPGLGGERAYDLGPR